MFTLPWAVAVVLVDALLLVVFLSLSDRTSADTLAPRCPFVQLASLAQKLRSTGGKLRSSGPTVGRVRQAVSYSAASP